ncbi:MAG: hypothetical protein JWO45_623 [Spartobacteria bacterium]|nr:hypothetical protein [Spartobacteria bacterium]
MTELGSTDVNVIFYDGREQLANYFGNNFVAASRSDSYEAEKNLCIFLLRFGRGNRKTSGWRTKSTGETKELVPPRISVALGTHKP